VTESRAVVFEVMPQTNIHYRVSRGKPDSESGTRNLYMVQDVGSDFSPPEKP
jgi:hypothetical protein